MAQKKISQLPAATTPLIGTEIVPVVQSAATKQTTVSSLGAGIGYTPAGTGAVITTVQAKLRETVSVKDFGAVGDGVTDDTAAIQAALNYSQTINGAQIYLPRGTYKTSSSLNIYKNTILRGEGRYSSIISYTGTGDGIKSTWPINSSTAVRIAVRDLALFCTNVANVGGGFADVGGSFVDLYNIYVFGFKYGIIFDQTEVSSIDNCQIESNLSVGALIWLVDGADHTVGALTGFTNRITITRNQFNSGVNVPWQIQIDGGGPHTIDSNNFNAGIGGIRAAAAIGLNFIANEIEGHSSSPMLLTNTKVSGTYVGPCLSPSISGNTFTDINLGHIYIDDCAGGVITSNSFNQGTAGSIYFNNSGSNRAAGVVIEGNSKIISGTYKQAAPFCAGNSVAYQRNVIRQCAQTYSLAAVTAGLTTVSVASAEFIYPGSKLWCINTDGTNGEWINVNDVTGTTIGATFGLNKNTNFLIYGTVANDRITGVNWTPIVFGTGPVGGATMTTQEATYSIHGTKCIVNARVVWTALTGGAAGNLSINLPIAARLSQMIPMVVTGATAIAANSGTWYMATAAGSTIASAAYVNISTGNLVGSTIGASGTVMINGAYDI